MTQSQFLFCISPILLLLCADISHIADAGHFHSHKYESVVAEWLRPEGRGFESRRRHGVVYICEQDTLKSTARVAIINLIKKKIRKNYLMVVDSRGGVRDRARRLYLQNGISPQIWNCLHEITVWNAWKTHMRASNSESFHCRKHRHEHNCSFSFRSSRPFHKSLIYP
jgi:hypothetical protein